MGGSFGAGRWWRLVEDIWVAVLGGGGGDIWVAVLAGGGVRIFGWQF